MLWWTVWSTVADLKREDAKHGGHKPNELHWWYNIILQISYAVLSSIYVDSSCYWSIIYTFAYLNLLCKKSLVKSHFPSLTNVTLSVSCHRDQKPLNQSLQFLTLNHKKKGERGHYWSIGLVPSAIPFNPFLSSNLPPLPLVALPTLSFLSSSASTSLKSHSNLVPNTFSSCCSSSSSIS